MAMFDQNDSAALLAAILTDMPYVTVTATHIRLGTNAPTATANMTELGGGSRVHHGRVRHHLERRVGGGAVPRRTRARCRGRTRGAAGPWWGWRSGTRRAAAAQTRLSPAMPLPSRPISGHPVSSSPAGLAAAAARTPSTSPEPRAPRERRDRSTRPGLAGPLPVLAVPGRAARAAVPELTGPLRAAAAAAAARAASGRVRPGRSSSSTPPPSRAPPPSPERARSPRGRRGVSSPAGPRSPRR